MVFKILEQERGLDSTESRHAVSLAVGCSMDSARKWRGNINVPTGRYWDRVQVYKDKLLAEERHAYKPAIPVGNGRASSIETEATSPVIGNDLVMAVINDRISRMTFTEWAAMQTVMAERLVQLIESR